MSDGPMFNWMAPEGFDLEPWQSDLLATWHWPLPSENDGQVVFTPERRGHSERWSTDDLDA